MNCLALQVRAVWCWEYWTPTTVITRKTQSTGGWLKSWIFCRVHRALTSSACMLIAHYGTMFLSFGKKRCTFNRIALCHLSIKGYITWMNFNMLHCLLWYRHRKQSYPEQGTGSAACCKLTWEKLNVLQLIIACSSKILLLC